MGRSIFICWLFSSSASGGVFVLVLLPPREKSYRPFPSPFKFLPVICIVLLTILSFCCFFVLPFHGHGAPGDVFVLVPLPQERSPIDRFHLDFPPRTSCFSPLLTSCQQPNTSFFRLRPDIASPSIQYFQDWPLSLGLPRSFSRPQSANFLPQTEPICLSVTFHKCASSIMEEII